MLRFAYVTRSLVIAAALVPLLVSCDSPGAPESLLGRRAGSGDASLLSGETTVAQVVALDATGHFTVNFGTTFDTLTSVQICILFGSDSWDAGETWFLNSVGGQINFFGPPRFEAMLNSPHWSTLVQFMDGVYSDSYSGPANPAGIMLILRGVPSAPLAPAGALSGPNSVIFGPLPAGGTESRTTWYKNVGGRDLLIGAIGVPAQDLTFPTPTPTVYALVSAPSTPLTLTPGDSISVTSAVTSATTGRTGRLILLTGEQDFCHRTTYLSASITAGAPPVANAGADITAQCTGPAGASITLNGSASYDPGGTIVSYEWRSAGGALLATGPTPTITLPVGTHAITLKVKDNSGSSATDVVNVTVLDTQAPTIQLSVSSPQLWPPNHKMVKVATGVTATDVCCTTPAVSVVVSSNEPENGLGDGDKSPDWQVVSRPDGTYDVWVRAERSGTGTARVYTIQVTATDDAGNVAGASATVTVPHDRGG